MSAKIQKKAKDVWLVGKKLYLCKLIETKNMNRFKTTLLRIYRFKALKYVVTVVLGIILVGFADENSIWSHFQNRQHISDLNAEINDYSNRANHDLQQIKALDRSTRAVERIARERYFMKKDNEDIFVLSDDEKPMNPEEE